LLVEERSEGRVAPAFVSPLVIDQPRVSAGAGDDKLGPEELGGPGHLVVVDDASLLVEAVRHGLEILGDSGNLLVGSLVAVREVAAVGEVEGKDAIVGLEDGSVSLEVGRAATQGLHIDTPLVISDVEGVEGTGLAEGLNLIDILVTSVVAGSRVSLRVLVGHDGAKGVKDSFRSKVLRGNQDKGGALTGFLLQNKRG